MCVRVRLISLLALFAGAAAFADSLRDLAARVDFGFYGGNPAVVAAAANELEPLAGRDGTARYLYALAQWRLAELHGEAPKAKSALTRCVDAASALTNADPGDAEAQVLVAACSTSLAALESFRSSLHERRAVRALAAARESDPANPRVAYLDALITKTDPATTIAVLEQAAARFAVTAGDGPVWGEAETQLLLAESWLGAGDRRRARDAVERALLAAPGYRRALELERRLAAGR